MQVLIGITGAGADAEWLAELYPTAMSSGRFQGAVRQISPFGSGKVYN